MNLDLTGKTALVCGSSQGIGFATAQELASMGCNVILFARNEERLQQAQSQLDVSSGQKHGHLIADFKSSNEVQKVIDAFIHMGGEIDILINNTGGPAAGNIENATTTEFIQAFESHLICNHILVQALLPGMKSKKWGRIVNVISTSVKSPLKGLGVSNTIRAAVANWSKTLATELAPEGITVNNVLPGFTETARAKDVVQNKAKKQGLSQHEVFMHLVKEIPVGRIAEAKEIAAAIGFLSSPSAGYITGINLPVDGGRLSCL